ncbi:MAG: hypothetical protein R6W86_13090 [Marinobacter sp.]|uniref:hypothetical protein n=1 Tax=Marinobacter sp. TaxID=50741 RepID=UPI00396F1B42
MNQGQGMLKPANTAYRGINAEPLPDSPVKRQRIGEELQPFGEYAGVIPYLQTIEDVEAVQGHEKDDPDFIDQDWWWDHQRIRFLNGKLGLKALILVIPLLWVLFLWLGGIALIVWGAAELVSQPNFSSAGATIVLVVGLLLSFGWFVFAIWATPMTTNWIMSTGIGFFLKPFEKQLEEKFDKSLEDGCSEFNRVTGQVRFALGRKRFFEAPFVEFDAYVERVVQQGGIFYRLMFVHRYTQKTFNQTWLSGIEASKTEVLALWDMLQRYMDVTQPLPDVPRLEPFRHLDPVTREYDEKIGRNPRYWRDLDIEAWKQGGGVELLNRLRSYPWGSRVCKLTPQLGKVSLKEYREMRPEGAWPI